MRAYSQQTLPVPAIPTPSLQHCACAERCNSLLSRLPRIPAM